ncbi:MAG TPA: AAA family ATPase, partial [Marmoricola sp.]|nr:AAA family ATPase [Marmoricola sp.]
MVGEDAAAWVATLAGRNDLPLLRSADLADGMLSDVATVAVHNVAQKRATFSRSNILAETLRQLHGVRFASPDERMHTVQRTVTFALNQSLLVTPPEVTHTPQQFTRPDGTSRFRTRGFELYTTQGLLDAEARLLEAGRDTTGPAIRAAEVHTATADSPEVRGRRLAPDQLAALEQVVASGRVLDVLVGPAGTGKSVTMAGLLRAWEHQHGAGSVVGLAPSATAAQVLADELGTSCENTAKWLTEHSSNPERLAQIEQLRAAAHRTPAQQCADHRAQRIVELAKQVEHWALHPGQLVIVDEASLAGTFALDAISAHAREVGAKVVLVGDWAQLSPVEAGGAFHLLVRDRRPAPTLTDARRFTHDWEKQASTRLRHGDTDVLEDYHLHDRIHGGEREEMLDAIFEAWRDDMTNGRSSLMLAADSNTVAELNSRARADRVLAGQVTQHGIHTGADVMIGVGDQVVTRRNDRRLSTGVGWVKNGDEWTVTGIAADGAVTVTRAPDGRRHPGGAVTLPADYVREHLELGYATTAYRAQGRTVDSAHAFVTVTTGREVLYVAATRGRQSNRLYVDTAYDPDTDTAHLPPAEQAPTEVLRRVLANRAADTSATETIEQTWNEQHSIARVWAEYVTIAAEAHRSRYDNLLASSGLSPAQLAQVRSSAAYGPLLAVLRDAEGIGLNVHKALPRLVQGRSLAGADDPASVLHGRVERWAQAAGGRVKATRSIAGLFPPAPPAEDSDIQRGLDDRAALIRGRALELASQAAERGHPWAARLGRPPA